MPFQPFSNTLTDCRAIEIPPTLDPDQRSRFVAKVAAAVRQQAEAAKRCPAILHLTGEVGEEGNRLLIPHEPATPADPGAVINADERPDIDTLWWLTKTTLDALTATATAKIVHGGIQFSSLYLDEAGRPKLGDYGIAPAFEEIRGIEARRFVHCSGSGKSTTQGRSLSGIWSLLSEDEAREFGWIAPYFPHELLERQTPLNLKSDQFALGVLLYLLATGTHPYGAALSDPNLGLYFQLEPYPLEEERAEWNEVFERQRLDLAQRADQPIVAWSKLVGMLLASEPEQRFTSARESGKLLDDCASPVWAEASEAIAGAFELWEQGEAEALLEKIRPWCENKALPALSRERLSAWAELVDSQKDSLRARKAREHRLAAGHEALELYNLEEARQAAREILDDPETEEDLHHCAEELLSTCDEQEQFIESGADAVAAAYLDAAAEALERGELEDARQVLQGLLQDPAMSPTRAAQARQLIGEVELAAQRLERHSAELAAGIEDDQRGDYVAAEQRLEALLAESELAKRVATPAAALLEQVRGKQKQRAEWLALLDETQTAWERGDLPAMEASLAQVLEDSGESEVDTRRRPLSEACARFRNASEKQAAAEQLLAVGQAAEAVTVVEQALALDDLPDVLQQTLKDQAVRARKIVEEQRAAARAQAASAWEQAQEHYQNNAIAECRQVLEESVLSAADLPADLRTQAKRLQENCARAELAGTALEQARRELSNEEFDAATSRLQEVNTPDLPASLIEPIEQLREDIVAARKEFIRRQEERLQQLVDSADDAIQAGRLHDAQEALHEAQLSEYLTDKLGQRVAELRATIAELRSFKRRAQPLVAAVRRAIARTGQIAAQTGRSITRGTKQAVVIPSRISLKAVRSIGNAARRALTHTRQILTKAARSIIKGTTQAVVVPSRALLKAVRSIGGTAQRTTSAAGRTAKKYAWPAVGAAVVATLSVAGIWYFSRPGDTDRATSKPDVVSKPDDATSKPVEDVVAVVESQPTAEPVVVEDTTLEPNEPDTIEIVEIEPNEPPVPTFAEAAEAFVSAVRETLPETFTGPSLPDEPTVPLSVGASWNGHVLLPYTDLAFDVESGAFSEQPAVVAAWFARQIDALRGLESVADITIELDERYDAGLILVNIENVQLVAVTEAAVDIDVVARARLRADPRPTVDFKLSGRLLERRPVLEVDDAGRSAFNTYLNELQKHQALAVVETIRPVLALPDGLQLECPAEFAGGDVCHDHLRYNDQKLATLPTLWNLSTLTYEPDQQVADDAIREGVAHLLKMESTLQALHERWPDVADQLALPDSHPGSRYYQRFRVLQLTPATKQPESPFATAVIVQLGSDGAASQERIDIILPVGFHAGVFTWDTSEPAVALDRIAATLQDWATNEDFRQRRQKEAIAQLAREVGMPANTIQAQREDEELSAEVSAEGRTTRYAWTWARLELAYANRRELAPPSLEEQLAVLADTPTFDNAQFVHVLQEITARKAEGYGAEDYRPGPELLGAADDPVTALTLLSRELQALTTPDPSSDPFPIVFVEYYAGPEDVYALSWRVETDNSSNITVVTDPQVWRVMPTIELHAFSQTAKFRQRYSSDANLGERLLGRALSEPGQSVHASTDGSFGIILAPHDRLWLVRWEQVRFNSRRIQGLDGRGAPDPGTFVRLRQVLQPHQVRRGGLKWRRAGVWCIPTLAGVWHGEAANAKLSLGPLAAGKPPVRLRFRSRKNGPFFAYVEDQTLSGDFAWRLYVNEVRREELGTTFWDRGWDPAESDPARWHATPYTSFSLLR